MISKKKKKGIICLLPFLACTLSCWGGLILVLFLCLRSCVRSPERVSDDASKCVREACRLSVIAGSNANISVADFRDCQWLKLASGTWVNYSMDSHGKILEGKYQGLELSVMIPKTWEEVSGGEFDKQFQGDWQHCLALPCVSHLLPCPAPTGGYICVSVVVPKIHLFGLLSDFFLYRVCLFFSFSISLWIFRVKDYVCMCMCLYLISFNKQRGKTVPKCCAKHLLSNLLSRVDTMFPIFFMRKVKLRQVNVTPPKVR